MRRIVALLDTVKATVWLFSPDMDLATAWTRPTRQIAKPLQITTRHVLGILRKAEETLSYRDITPRMMQVLDVSVADGTLVDTIRKRVGTCMRRQAGHGLVVKEKGIGLMVRWNFAA